MSLLPRVPDPPASLIQYEAPIAVVHNGGMDISVGGNRQSRRAVAVGAVDMVPSAASASLAAVGARDGVVVVPAPAEIERILNLIIPPRCVLLITPIALRAWRRCS